MSNRICLNCKGTKIREDKYIEDGSDCFVCTDCCRIGTAEEFPIMTVFHRITTDEETLAPLLVRVNVSERTGIFYTSVIVCGVWNDEAAAIAATVEKLKEVAK